MWLWIALGVLALLIAALLLRDALALAAGYIRKRLQYRREAEERIAYNRERARQRIGEQRGSPAPDPDQEQPVRLRQMMETAEALFEKYGAEPLDINRRNREMLGQRRTYLYSGNYYRVDHAVFDGIPFMIFHCIDDPRYAAVGVMEDVEALPLTLTDEELDKEVRYLFGLEPYPENYPAWQAEKEHQHV